MKRKQYFVICPSGDTVCTYVQYIVNNVWGGRGKKKKALVLLCVIK